MLLLSFVAGCGHPPAVCGGDVAGLVGAEGWSDLQAAVDAAAPGGTVTVCPGTWQGTVRVAKDLVIESRDGADATTLDANRSGSVIFAYDGANLTVRGLTLTGGNGMRETFTDQWRYGGGVAAWFAGDVVVEDTVFTDNTGEWTGGGLDVEQSASLTVRDSTFTENRAYGAGGGLLAYALGALEIDGATFTGNRTGWMGGALVVYEVPACELRGLEVTDNGTDGEGSYTTGGGAFLYATTCSLADSTFTGNTATDGGAITVEYADLAMTGVEIRDNVADAWGGGLLTIAYGRDVILAGDGASTIADNHADAGFGGGLAAYTLGDGSRVIVRDLVVSGNSALGAGGVYALDEGGVEGLVLDGVTITGNSAAELGGGLGVSSPVALVATVIDTNSAPYGGGVAMDDALGLASAISADADSRVTGNDATAGGGVIAVPNTGAGFSISGLVVAGNTAGQGGGIAVLDEGLCAPLTLSALDLDANSATEGGGLHLGCPTTLDTSLVRANVADSGGGAWLQGLATLSSTASAWGGEGEENDPEDVVVSGVPYSSPGTDFACDAATAACTP